MKRAALIATAAAAYVLAAWAVAPGFYDGFTPPQPYNWVSPPPQVTGNKAPKSGHLVVKVINGVSDANSAFSRHRARLELLDASRATFRHQRLPHYGQRAIGHGGEPRTALLGPRAGAEQCLLRSGFRRLPSSRR